MGLFGKVFKFSSFNGFLPMTKNSGARDNLEDYTTIDGLFHGGGFYLLGVQVHGRLF